MNTDLCTRSTSAADLKDVGFVCLVERQGGEKREHLKFERRRWKKEGTRKDGDGRRRVQVLQSKEAPSNGVVA